MRQVRLLMKLGLVWTNVYERSHWYFILDVCHCKYEQWSQVIVNVASKYYGSSHIHHCSSNSLRDTVLLLGVGC